MSFQFDSLSAFFAMGGHGPFVWSCYGVALLTMGYLVIAPSVKTKQFFKEQRQLQLRLRTSAQQKSATHNAGREPDATA